MIYLALTADPQTLAVPRNGGGRGPFRLELEKGGLELAFDGLEDEADGGPYVVVTIEGSDELLVTGEYNYRLVDESGTTASLGILTAGDYERPAQDAGEYKVIEYDGR